MAYGAEFEISLITALSVLALVAGIRLGRRFARVRPPLLAASLLLSLGYAWSFSGRLGWASVLPIGTLVVWSNLMPVLLSWTSGLAVSSQRLPQWRRPATIGVLMSLALAYTIAPLARPIVAPMEVDPTSRWRGDVCLQSHPSSCAPAAAATLLRMHGIASTESKLARACYTSRQGTEPLGLVRGLAVASHQRGIRPEIAATQPHQWADNGQLPNIALVQFERMGQRQPLNRLLGPRGEGHAVVVIGQTQNGQWLIADPAFGRTVWTDDQFNRRFTGDAVYLSRR